MPLKAVEKSPDAKPRIISDKRPQFIARDSKHFIRLTGMDSEIHAERDRNLEEARERRVISCLKPGR